MQCVGPRNRLPVWRRIQNVALKDAGTSAISKSVPGSDHAYPPVGFQWDY